MNKYLEKIAANMKDFAFVRMQNLDNTNDDHHFTAKKFKHIKYPDTSGEGRLNNLIGNANSVIKNKVSDYIGSDRGSVKVTRSKKGYYIEVIADQLDRAGRRAPSGYYKPGKHISPEEVIHAITGAGAEVNRTFDPKHLAEIEHGINHVNRKFRIHQGVKAGILTAGAIGSGLLIKKIVDKYGK